MTYFWCSQHEQAHAKGDDVADCLLVGPFPTKEGALEWATLPQPEGKPMSHDTDKPPSAREALHKWLRDNAPDCGDNSCVFGGRGKGGMRTNGGCRCYKDLPSMKRIYVERLYSALAAALPQGEGPGCMDCGKPYSEFRLDTTLPDEQWRAIHESEGGVLCANCMVARLAKLPGAIAVRARLEIAKRWTGKRAC